MVLICRKWASQAYHTAFYTVSLHSRVRPRKCGCFVKLITLTLGCFQGHTVTFKSVALATLLWHKLIDPDF